MSKTTYLLEEVTVKYKKRNRTITKIHSSLDIKNYICNIVDFDTLIEEHFYVIFLNRANNIIGWYQVSIGGVSASIVDIKKVLTAALGCLASSIICVHNHPSGNLKPSNADIKITNKIKNSIKLLDMSLLDHIIVGNNQEYYSFSDEGVL